MQKSPIVHLVVYIVLSFMVFALASGMLLLATPLIHLFTDNFDEKSDIACFLLAEGSIMCTVLLLRFCVTRVMCRRERRFQAGNRAD